MASGEARISDNLACAAIFFVDAALVALAREAPGPLDEAQHAAVGELACAVSHGLATLIREPNSWRIAALVSAARLIAPHLGLSAAARAAATAARDHSKTLKAGLDGNLLQVTGMAMRAVESNDAALAGTAVKLIAERITSVRDSASARRAVPL